MAKEEQTTVGLNKSTMALVAVVLTVLAASAFWKDRGGSEAKAEATHNYVIESVIKTNERQDELISGNAKDITAIEKGQHVAEVARTKLEGKMDVFSSEQQATTVQMTEFKNEFKDMAKYLKQFNYDNKKDTK